MLSPIRTRPSAVTSMTTTGGLTAPSGCRTTLVANAGGSTRPVGGPTARPIDDTMTPPGGLIAPPGGLTARVAKAGDQTEPPCSPPARVAKADGLTANQGGPTARSITLTPPAPRAATTTSTLCFAPCATLTTPALTSAPHAALTTPPAASSATFILPSAAQLVPHVLSAGVVPISLMVHTHPMWI
jgi:hypothetical protein